MRGLKESMQYMDTDRRLSGLNKQTSSLANCEKELKYFQAKTISLTNFCVVLLSLGLCLIHIYMNSSIDSMIVSGVLQISSFGPVIALANLGSTLSQTIGAGQRVISLLDESTMIEEIEKKEEQSVEYEHTDELWLNIYIPWVENIVSYEMDIGKSDIATIRKRLLQSKFQRIYLSSIREHDTFVLKTNNGKDMLDEEHCISTIDVS